MVSIKENEQEVVKYKSSELKELESQLSTEKKRTKSLEKELRDITLLSRDSKRNSTHYNDLYVENIRKIRDHILALYNRLISTSIDERNRHTFNSQTLRLSFNDSQLVHPDNSLNMGPITIILEDICNLCDNIYTKTAEEGLKVSFYSPFVFVYFYRFRWLNMKRNCQS